MVDLHAKTLQNQRIQNATRVHTIDNIIAGITTVISTGVTLKILQLKNDYDSIIGCQQSGFTPQCPDYNDMALGIGIGVAFGVLAYAACQYVRRHQVEYNERHMAR